jgi:hypothetical protein
MRNPWGKEDYAGTYHDGDTRWNAVSDEVKTSIGYTNNAGDGIFFIPIEDYVKEFAYTQVNHDVTDGWFGGHYLYLNDPGLKNGSSWACGSDCTRHSFKLTNTS